MSTSGPRIARNCCISADVAIPGIGGCSASESAAPAAGAPEEGADMSPWSMSPWSMSPRSELLSPPWP